MTNGVIYAKKNMNHNELPPTISESEATDFKEKERLTPQSRGPRD